MRNRWESEPIEIITKTELDPDFGDCLYCYINGKKAQYYVRAGEGAEVHLLKGVIAEYHTKQSSEKRKYEKLEQFQDAFRHAVNLGKAYI